MPVMARTTREAIRHPREGPPGRQARARTRSGETTARKRKMCFRSTTSFETGFFLCDLSARVLSRTLDLGCWGVRRSKYKSANHHAHHRYLLSRRNFVVVFLRRTGLGGIKKALRGQSGIPVEDRADG